MSEEEAAQSPEERPDNSLPLSVWDRRLGPWMFWLSWLTLALLAGAFFSPWKWQHALALAVCGPLFWGEALLQRLSGGRMERRHWLGCFFFPLRIAAPDHVEGRAAWLPGWGWQECGRELQERLDHALSGPMLGFALLILPVLGIEHYCRIKGGDLQVMTWQDLRELPQKKPTKPSDKPPEKEDEQQETQPPPQPPRGGLTPGNVIRFTESIIWLAFASELLIAVSVTDKKLRYLVKHWLDVAIVCLPAIAVLRTLRLTQLLRLQQVMRLARMYRLRGLGMRLFRAVLVLELLSRLWPAKPKKKIAQLLEKIEEKEYELQKLREELLYWESQIVEEPADEDATA